MVLVIYNFTYFRRNGWVLGVLYHLGNAERKHTVFKGCKR
jgi:hypothetical protein